MYTLTPKPTKDSQKKRGEETLAEAGGCSRRKKKRSDFLFGLAAVNGRKCEGGCEKERGKQIRETKRRLPVERTLRARNLSSCRAQKVERNFESERQDGKIVGR